MTCFDDELLERHLLSPIAAVTSHLEGCEACRTRVSEAEAQGRQFRAFVFPRTVDALLAQAAPRPVWGAWKWVPLALAATLVGGVLLFPKGAPDDAYVGLKGTGALHLSVFTAQPGREPLAVGDGARLAPKSSLRFRVAPGSACSLWVVSVDMRGEVSRIFPASGPAARISALTDLPGGAVLDSALGPERVFAVCSPEPLSFDEVAAAGKRLGVGAEPVRAARELPGLPPGTRQATLLLEKGP